MIDRVRLTAAAKVQLATIKRRTGIEHYNSICRHALCLSLGNNSSLPEEEFNFSGGMEIDWKVFAGAYGDVYLNMLLLRMHNNGDLICPESLKKMLNSHLHRGLSYMSGRANSCFPKL